MVVHSEKKVVREFYVLCNISCVMIVDRRCQKYFTVDDEQTDLKNKNYLAIGTLVSYKKLRDYYGEEKLVPIYIEVENGERLARALERERGQNQPNYDELCRRFLADNADFSEENLTRAGIKKRFQNKELQKCVEEITVFISEKAR